MKTTKARWLLSLLGVAAAVALASGSAVAVPQESGEAEEQTAVASQPVTSSDEAPEATVTIGGMQVGVDPETGEIQPLSKAEAAKLAREMRKLFKPRKLERIENADGSLSAVVSPNVLRYSVARVEADGTVSQDCVESPDAALEFVSRVESKQTPQPEEE